MKMPLLKPSPPDEFDTAAEVIADHILHAEEIAEESGGCIHTPDDDDWQCWHCRLRMMTLIIGHALRTRARREQPPSLGEVIREEPAEPKFRNCNRHSDCVASESIWSEKHPGQHIPASFHCHDDCCEDCFGQ